MTKELSDKLRVASFLATCMVVLRHSANWVAFFPNGHAPQWMLDIEWNLLFCTDVAVPFFFFVSGFLFMRTSYQSLPSYWQMIRKKFMGLLVPYLIWNLVGGFILLFHDSEGNLGNSVSSCLTNCFMGRWYGPLWYVRDVIIMMFAVPLYGWLYQRRCQLIMVLLILWQMYAYWHPGWNDLLAGEGVVFFLLGGLVQQYSSLMEWKAPKWLCWVMLGLWLFLSCEVTSWDRDIHRLCLLVSLPAFWFSLDLIAPKLKFSCLSVAPFSFLIYVTHFYLHKVFKVGLAHLFPENAAVAILSFFVIPIVTIAIIIYLGGLWKQYHPQSYYFCTGGR